MDNPLIIFLIGLGIFALFLWYFGTDSARKKRGIGTFLAFALTAFCLWAVNPPGEKIQKGIDLQGGSSFVIALQTAPGSEREITSDAQQQAIGVIEKRLNPEGTVDLLIAPQGEDRILIQMPGITEEEVDKVKKTIETTAKLDFALVHQQSAVLVPQIDSGNHIEPGWTVRDNIGSEEGERLLVKVRPDLEGKYVKRAFAQLAPTGWMIILNFDSEGAGKFGDLTAANVGRRLAIIMDGEVLSAPNLNEAIYGGSAQISGRFTVDEARSLASALENPLENPVKIIQKYEVSPTMGESTIKQGVAAGLSGLAVTLLFVLIYYKFAGIVALVGLTVNIILLFGAMAMFGFTLTLPGIAGIILTIGIAIDANVLIYERLREEMKAGKSLPTAIDAAYAKAFSAIFDANITTLITAIILFNVASGTVKGFAVTLTIGILASLFSALVVTRVCFGWATESGVLKKLSLLNIIPERRIDFLGKRRACFVLSCLLVAMTLVIFGVKKQDTLGVDFRGGDLLTVKATSEVTEDDVLNAISDMGLEQQPVVQTLQAAGEGEFIIVRSEFETGDQILEEIRKDLGQDFKDATSERVGPVIGREMAKSSLLALGFGIVGIFLYVTVRFEFSFALGAIVALLHDISIALGIVVLSGRELSLILVGAFLTIAGYSINDTIVVFDRVREGLRSKRGEVADVMNLCINATLGRTLLTSLTTLITVGSLYFFGGPALNNFAFTIIVGVFIGTYSSIFVASPIVLWWVRTRKKNLRREILDAEQAAVNPAGTP